jgi:hypothetical protein
MDDAPGGAGYSCPVLRYLALLLLASLVLFGMAGELVHAAEAVAMGEPSGCSCGDEDDGCCSPELAGCLCLAHCPVLEAGLSTAEPPLELAPPLEGRWALVPELRCRLASPPPTPPPIA